MAEKSKLDILRGQHNAVLDYERSRTGRRGPRSPRELRPQLETMGRHLAQWSRLARAAGSSEESPLVPLCNEWQEALGIQPTPAATEPAPEPAQRPKKNGKPTADQRRAASLKGAETRKRNAAPPVETIGNGKEDAGGDDPTYKILGKGDWLMSHARIIREQIPKVKSAAADPAAYDKAKHDFLGRNLPLLRAYCKEPTKGHSPLFAYCVMYLSDLRDTGAAIDLAEKAVELRQTSPIKRNFHELLFDVRLAKFERDAPAVSVAGKGPPFDAFEALRKQLMEDPFRGNHAKAKVCKIFAQVCMALGDYEPAGQNLQRVKFLDPNMGVETLLAQCDEKLK